MHKTIGASEPERADASDVIYAYCTRRTSTETAIDKKAADLLRCVDCISDKISASGILLAICYCSLSPARDQRPVDGLSSLRTACHFC